MQRRSEQEPAARDECRIVKQSSSVRQSGKGLELPATSDSMARRRSGSGQDGFEDRIPAVHAAPQSPGHQAGLFTKSPSLFQAMGEAVSELATEFGSAMDRWGGRIETKVEELLPGWVPPVSAFDEALSGRAPAGNAGPAAASPRRRQQRNVEAAGDGWDAWDWSQEEPDRPEASASPRREARQPAALRRSGQAQPPARELAELRQSGGRLSAAPSRMPPVSTQAYQQLQLTLEHLLGKHEALREQHAKLLAEHQTLQSLVELMAAQQPSDSESEAEEASELLAEARSPGAALETASPGAAAEACTPEPAGEAASPEAACRLSSGGKAERRSVHVTVSCSPGAESERAGEQRLAALLEFGDA